jgi:DNA ligase-1
MKYKELCEIYEKLESTSKGLEKTKIIADFLPLIKDRPDEIYLLQGKIFPDYDGRELGISFQLIIKAISKASGYSEEDVVKKYKELGDLGLAVEELYKNKRQNSLFFSELTIEKIFSNLSKIPLFLGKGTVSMKIDLIVDLLQNAKPIEAKYLVRLVLGEMRIGVGEGILRDAIIEFCFKPNDINEKKEHIIKVQEAYDKTNDFSLVFQKSCLNKLDEIELSVGKPVKVMLYPKAKDAEDAFRIVGKPAAFEYKYDGFRMMINKLEDGEVKIFTRRLEEVSEQFPDIIEFVKKYIDAKSFIVDCEAVGYDSVNKKYKTFQNISQRIKRKYEIEKLIKEIPVALRIFDVIYYNGKSYLDKSYEERRRLLEKIVKEKDWEVLLAKRIVTDNLEEAEEFFREALDDGQEGLMVKGLDKLYKPGARIGYGVKWKPIDKDFDLVITGAEWGNGKRAGWLTSFDVSCKDENDNLLEIGKVGSGIKEKLDGDLSFEELTELLKPLITKEQGKHIQVKPEIIVTIQYQNIQQSPSYSSGYALRFPRIKNLRPDRSITDVATINEIEKEVGE